MGLRICALFALLLVACAPTLGSFQALGQLQLLQRIEGLPDDWVIPGETHTKFIEPLKKWAVKQQITVEEGDLEPYDLFGVTQVTDKGTLVVLHHKTTGNMRFATLVHELSHTLHGTYLAPRAAEVYAEVVSVQVCGRLGLDISRQSAAYLLRYAPISLQWATTQKFAADMDKVVVVLVAAAKGEGK